MPEAVLPRRFGVLGPSTYDRLAQQEVKHVRGSLRLEASRTGDGAVS